MADQLNILHNWPNAYACTIPKARRSYQIIGECEQNRGGLHDGMKFTPHNDVTTHIGPWC